MAAATHLDLVDTQQALRAVAAVLDDHRAALDRLDLGEDWNDVADPNDAVVVPARPGAGTDLATAVGAAADAAAQARTFAELAASLEPAAHGAALGAAGRQVAAVLGGMGEPLRNADALDGTRLALGLELAAERLATADDGRHAGCLAAVVGIAADAALAAVDQGAELADVVIAAADEGLVELESGPRVTPRLVERGVVDAAAAGFLLMLDVLASVITGEPLPAAPSEPAAPRPSGAGILRYRVRCCVQPHDGCGLESANWLESTWHDLGELVDFDGVSAPWRVELVTAVPGAAIEAIAEVGRPRELLVELVDTGA